MLSDAFIFVVDNPILMLFAVSAGFPLFWSRKIGFSGLWFLVTIPFIPDKPGHGCRAHIGYSLQLLSDNLTTAHPARGEFRGWFNPGLSFSTDSGLRSWFPCRLDHRLHSVLGHCWSISGGWFPPLVYGLPGYSGSSLRCASDRQQWSPVKVRSSMGICLPFLVSVLSLDREPLRYCFPLLEWDPALLEWDSCQCLSCITCKALSLFASRSRSNGSVFRGLATSTWVSVTVGI